ncbi:hypothetical protein [Microseira sp. BLCC-F43]|jgi:hypothetical protein|uniref:hypothetical protein n=1 Tax=Microseira sp. BLCC-F43 TaxID=3153602 RepID=UPI0035BAB764
MQTKVWQVVDVGVGILKSSPPQLFIIASGVVNYTEWSHPTLIPYYYFIPPQDGIYDFDFVAEAPSEIVIPVVTPVVTTFIWENLPDGVMGVSVHGSTGEPKIKMLAEYSFNDIQQLVWHRPGFESMENG